MQHLAMDARTWTSVSPGGHSVRHTEVVPTFDTEPTNHSNGGKHGSEPIPIGFAVSKHNKKDVTVVTTGIVQILSAL